MSSRHLKQHGCSFTAPRKPRRDELLGLGLPLNEASRLVFGTQTSLWDLRFPNALEDWCGEPLTLRERAMMSMMARVMSKVDWPRKVFDEEICSKWKQEALSKDFSARMFDHCIGELRDNAAFFRQNGYVPILDAQATIYAGNDSIQGDTKRDLQRGAAILENRPAAQRDWHPGSDGKVLNLVHPSLYPLVYGRTRVLISDDSARSQDDIQTSSTGEVIPVPRQMDCRPYVYWALDHESKPQLYSQRFQWLPCDVHFVEGDGVRIASYINNLHPEDHEDLYHTIEKVIAMAVPLWDHTLSALRRNTWTPRINITAIQLDEGAMSKPRPRDEDEDEIDEWEKECRDMEWRDELYAIVPPEPQEYATWARSRQIGDSQGGSPVNLRRDFADRGLQVIVKLANIHLTPDKPEYEGGSWHVEGQLNEHIVATALYYYSSANTTDSHLAFRECVREDSYEALPYEHGQMHWIEEYFGITNQVPFIQELGRVLTREGRLLAFPNVLQHRLEPFRLADPSQNGHRKVLALFLVDPHLRIPSTAVVPPQQREWWERGLAAAAMPDLSTESAEQFLRANGDALMDVEEARVLRMELMAERSAFVRDVETPRLRAECNLCEH